MPLLAYADYAKLQAEKMNQMIMPNSLCAAGTKQIQGYLKKNGI
jgi:hypothetical protein